MEHFFSWGFNPHLTVFFFVIIILSNHPGVSKDFKRKLPLKISAFVCILYAHTYITSMPVDVYAHICIILCVTALALRIHKSFFYSDSASGIPSQQKYEVPQLHASGFKLQALSFLWPLYRILILSFLPRLSSSRVITETYWLKEVPSPQKTTAKKKSCELPKSHPPASQVIK